MLIFSGKYVTEDRFTKQKYEKLLNFIAYDENK